MSDINIRKGIIVKGTAAVVNHKLQDFTQMIKAVNNDISTFTNTNRSLLDKRWYKFDSQVITVGWFLLGWRELPLVGLKLPFLSTWANHTLKSLKTASRSVKPYITSLLWQLTLWEVHTICVPLYRIKSHSWNSLSKCADIVCPYMYPVYGRNHSWPQSQIKLLSKQFAGNAQLDLQSRS